MIGNPVSILVITRGRPKLLARVLSDLKKQQYQETFEIVVVEETDTPIAPEGVIYVPHPMKNLGIAYARNLSVEHAQYDTLVFIDDDCRVAPDWLSKLVKPLTDEDVLGVQGGVVVPEGTNAVGWAECLLGFPGGGVTRVVEARGQVQQTIEVSTLNACYRKSEVLKVGGFSSAARFGGEDYLLAKRIAKHGKLLFVPDAMVKHEARGNVVAIWTWFIRRGRAEFDLYDSGDAPEDFLGWMLRSSLALKLTAFILLICWSALPLLGFVVLMIGMNLWRFRWVLSKPEIPSMAWFFLPWVRVIMSLATDVGRFKAWRHK
ncbi:MAG: glycosyltransferase [Ghiorsea sp.]